MSDTPSILSKEEFEELKKILHAQDAAWAEHGGCMHDKVSVEKIRPKPKKK